MGVIIAVTNRKGGSGKTTTGLTLAVELALMGYRVLAIDGDDNAGLTDWLMTDSEQSQELADEVTACRLLTDAEQGITGYGFLRAVDLSFDARNSATGKPRYSVDALRQVAPRRGWREGKGRLDLIPGSEAIRTVEVQLQARGRDLGRSVFDPTQQLVRALAQARTQYDVILLDCPPADSLWQRNALYAADYLFIPLPPNRLSLRAFQRLQRVIGEVATARSRSGTDKGPQIAGIMLTMFMEGQSAHRAMLQLFREQLGSTLCSTVVPLDPAVDLAVTLSVPLQLNQPASAAAEAFHLVTQEVCRRVGLA